MSLSGGLLWLVDGGPAPRLDGLALAPLAATEGPASLEVVFDTRQPIQNGRWQSIVIHHSGSMVGTPESIEAQHRARNATGLGHHFLIGNGSGIRDGELHVGYRWLDQLPGAHAGGPDGDWFNRNSISICLIGDGERRDFTDAQFRRLVDLVADVQRHCGIPDDRVYLYREIAATSAPGRHFPAAEFRESLALRR